MARHPKTFRWLTILILLATTAAPAPFALAAMPPTICEVELRNLSSQLLPPTPVTFGQVFRKGDVPHSVVAMLGSQVIPTQMDVKNRHAEGSVKFGLVTVNAPELPANEGRKLALAALASPAGAAQVVKLSDLLKTDFDAVVSFTFPEGARRTISARRLLTHAGETAPGWLRGPLAAEWLLAGTPADADGRPDEDLRVQFQVRAYAGCQGIRVSVVVENCWDTWAGNIRYDVAVSVGGKELFAAKAVDHRPLSRWRKVFWWGDGEAPVHVIQDTAYLFATGALPNYDTSLPPSPPDWQLNRDLQMQGPDWDILGKGSLTAYMPTTGGRPEIAPYPAWTVRYLLHREPRLRDIVLANGDLAGSWPIHVRARATGRIMTIDERPDFWLDDRGKDKPAWKPDRHPPSDKQVKLTPDLAHQGSLAYTPYLLTGDYYHLEEAYFWANYCLLATWPHPRQGANGILAGQIRGDAWALRNLADAAWIAAEGDPETDYFDRKIRNNLADRTARMYGPPEYNRLGFWGLRTTQDARIQNPANPDWLIVAPWEHDYLMWSLHHIVELGYADAAKPRDFLLRWRVGTLVNAPDFNPMLATPYRMVVGEKSADGKTIFYDDWKKLGDENSRLSKPDLPNYGNSYAYSARAAVVCGVDGGFPDARKALEWLEAHLPNHRQVMAQNPSWAIQPRRGAGTPKE